MTGSEDGTIRIWDLRWVVYNLQDLLAHKSHAGVLKCIGHMITAHLASLISSFITYLLIPSNSQSQWRLCPSKSGRAYFLRSSGLYQAVGLIWKPLLTWASMFRTRFQSSSLTSCWRPLQEMFLSDLLAWRLMVLVSSPETTRSYLYLSIYYFSHYHIGKVLCLEN